MGRYEVNGIQFKIDERAKAPTVGTRVLSKYFKSDSYKTDTEYILIPKRVPREWKAKPVKEKPKREPKGKKKVENKDSEDSSN